MGMEREKEDKRETALRADGGNENEWESEGVHVCG